TPPGINGTAPRAMPSAGTSFGERTWTRRFEQDLLKLIRKEKLVKPIIVAASHPASNAALELAIENPQKVGAVVLAGSQPLQFFASPKDPTRTTPGTVQERVDAVDTGWGAKWFKYVTPETWNSNDMRPELLSNDLTRGQIASQEIEEAPLPV